MAGGSITPESDTDQRCKHCRLYFAKQGIRGHENACQMKGVDLETYAREVLDERVDPAGEGATPEGSPLPEGEDPTPDPEGSPPAATDGGGEGLGLEGPPDRDGENGDTVACPNCGDDTGATPDELEAGQTYRCTECGEIFVWRVTE